MWGGRVNRGAEPLFFEVAAELEICPPNEYIAGLSFDVAKAFDRIPRELLQVTSCSTWAYHRVCLQPYLHMLRHATRRYKFD